MSLPIRTRPGFAALALVLLVPGGYAQAQPAPSEPPYCAQLQRIAALALTKDRLASITGKSRDGDFTDTTLPLTGWKDCSLYGPRNYTCDSREFPTAEAAEQAQAGIVREVQACLGRAWSEAKDRSSPSYVVLHSATAPLSITLSRDETDTKQYLVRLILFARGR
jgi:hypothetical protein